MPTVRIQEKNYSESIMVLKLKDGYFHFPPLYLPAVPLLKFLFLIPDPAFGNGTKRD